MGCDGKGSCRHVFYSGVSLISSQKIVAWEIRDNEVIYLTCVFSEALGIEDTFMTHV